MIEPDELTQEDEIQELGGFEIVSVYEEDPLFDDEDLEFLEDFAAQMGAVE